MPKWSVYPRYLSKNQVAMLIQEIRYGLMLDDLPPAYHPDSELMVFEQVNNSSFAPLLGGIGSKKRIKRQRS
jgi:hypothetical protein